MDYLREAGDEVMNFLTAEYDYDMDIKVNREEAYTDGYKKGEEQGIEQGIEQGVLSSVRNLIDSMDITAEEAMKYLMIPEEKQKEYLDRL